MSDLIGPTDPEMISRESCVRRSCESTRERSWNRGDKRCTRQRPWGEDRRTKTKRKVTKDESRFLRKRVYIIDKLCRFRELVLNKYSGSFLRARSRDTCLASLVANHLRSRDKSIIFKKRATLAFHASQSRRPKNYEAERGNGKETSISRRSDFTHTYTHT